MAIAHRVGYQTKWNGMLNIIHKPKRISLFSPLAVQLECGVILNLKIIYLVKYKILIVKH